MILEPSKLCLTANNLKSLYIEAKSSSPTTLIQFLESIDGLIQDSSLNSRDQVVSTLNLSLINIKPKFERLLQRLLTILYNSYYAISNVNKNSNNNIKGSEDISKAAVTRIIRQMHVLEWPIIFHQTYLSFFELVLNNKIKALCAGNYDERFCGEIEEWIRKELSVFVIELYSNNIDSKHHPESILTIIEKKILHSSIVKIRADELFEMVADYPDSVPALCELRDSMNIADMIGHVGQTFRATIKKRLLHMGASTSQILDMYVLMIKALRVADSSDLLLNYVTRPVRQYLLSRKDTVRCITISLTESTDSNLHGELRKGGPVSHGEEDDEDAGPGEGWVPRKRNPLLADISRSKGKDILAVLVSIYGSSDIFVQEYRSLLAEKLLSNTAYNIDLEIATVELLKIRFGEESMHSCEVMLHDIENSKRVNNSVSHIYKKSNASDHFPVDYAIISEHYWPQLSEDTIKHHPSIQSSLDIFEQEFAAVKKPRKIHPVGLLGRVEIDLEFDDGSVRSFSVTPVQASIVQNIAIRGRISFEELWMALEVDESVVKAAISFWISRHVIREVNDDSSMQSDLYEIIEQQSEYLENGFDSFAENDVPQVSLEREPKSSTSKLEPYIRGLLTGHGAMTIERIHNMLKLLTAGSDISFDLNLIQFRSYMQQLIEGDVIEFVDGQYRLHGK